nr:immunoglobulin light chain junction region [Macaca mulatta]
CLQTKISPWTF